VGEECRGERLFALPSLGEEGDTGGEGYKARPFSAADLSQDPLLQKRLTVWLKMEPLRDALRAIGKHTGVVLRCQDAIAQEKVAIFVRERPAHEILTQLAAALRYAWRRDEDAYVLYVPDETRQAEEQLRRELADLRRQAIRDWIQAAREVLQMPPEQRRQLREQFRQSSQPLTPQQEVYRELVRDLAPVLIPISAGDGEVELREIRMASESIYQCLVTLPDTALDALAKGQVIGFSTKPPRGVYPIPTSVSFLPYLMDIISEHDGQDVRSRAEPTLPEFAGFWIRTLPHRRDMMVQIVGTQHARWMEAGRVSEEKYLVQMWMSVLLPLTPYLRDSAFGQFWERWATPLEALQERLPERAAKRPFYDAYTEARLAGKRLSLAEPTTADGLERLALIAEVPIISDAYRVASFYRLKESAFAPRALARELAGYLWMRWDESGYLLARHRNYLGYRTVELPEAWLRPLEAKYDENRLTMDDFIDLAGKLSEEQAQRLWGEGAPIHLNARFDGTVFVDCLPALRFLASLDARQRRALMAGEWLPLRTMTPLQRRRFTEATREAFPPPDALFNQPLPAGVRRPYSPVNRRLPSWYYINLSVGVSEKVAARAPELPAVRLMPVPREVFYYAVDEESLFGRFYAGNEEQVRARMLKDLEQSPELRFAKATVQGYEILFLTPTGERKYYVFYLRSVEPSRLMERAPKPSEGGESR
jgi:hypothetical protein